MAVKIKKIKKSRGEYVPPLNSINYIIMGIGILLIVLGYILLANSEVEGFIPLVISPILLVFGYCVLVPFGIIYRKKEKELPSEFSVSEL
ncbi:MAG: hypothetical protein KGZ58_08145 [Ignavibacteriales bacterium]|nr:hypothetical protein [Ignavibacteriales bacterium]